MPLFIAFNIVLFTAVAVVIIVVAVVLIVVEIVIIVVAIGAVIVVVVAYCVVSSWKLHLSLLHVFITDFSTSDLRHDE